MSWPAAATGGGKTKQTKKAELAKKQMCKPETEGWKRWLEEGLGDGRAWREGEGTGNGRVSELNKCDAQVALSSGRAAIKEQTTL